MSLGTRMTRRRRLCGGHGLAYLRVSLSAICERQLSPVPDAWSERPAGAGASRPLAAPIRDCRSSTSADEQGSADVGRTALRFAKTGASVLARSRLTLGPSQNSHPRPPRYRVPRTTGRVEVQLAPAMRASASPRRTVRAAALGPDPSRRRCRSRLRRILLVRLSF